MAKFKKPKPKTRIIKQKKFGALNTGFGAQYNDVEVTEVDKRKPL